MDKWQWPWHLITLDLGFPTGKLCKLDKWFLIFFFNIITNASLSFLLLKITYVHGRKIRNFRGKKKLMWNYHLSIYIYLCICKTEYVCAHTYTLALPLKTHSLWKQVWLVINALEPLGLIRINISTLLLKLLAGFVILSEIIADS